MLKMIGVLVVVVPLLMARTGLTTDGEKYLAEARTRVARIEKTIDAALADPKAAQAAADHLLSSKRFLDNVQKEQPASKEAAALQKRADVLLARLEPALLKTAIATRLESVEDVLASLEKDLAGPLDEKVAFSVENRFEQLRGMVKDVLEKDPSNVKAKELSAKENALWQTYREQREKGGK